MTASHRTGIEESAGDGSAENEVLSELLERIPGGLFRYRAEGDGTLDLINSDLVEIFGCESREQFRELTGNAFRGMVLPEDWERIDREIWTQTNKTGKVRVHYRIRRADGEIRWVDDSTRLVEDSKGVRWLYANVIDITPRIETQRQLEQANERLDILTALSNDILFDIQCTTGEADVYGDFRKRFGREPEQDDFVVHRRCQNECNLDIKTHELPHFIEQFNDKNLVDFETSTVDAKGNPIWYRYQSVVLHDERGMPIRHVGRLLDTHEMVLRESSLRRKAERDGLTGLYNRAAAIDRIRAILKVETRPCTFISIDVDDFKSVNDTYGHPEGDRVLKDLATFLSQAMRREDVVARMGGDEFAIFAPGLGPGDALERILAHLARGPFAASRSTDAAEPEMREVAPSVSIGAACCENPPIAFEDLYEAADEVLYKAKNAGKAGYDFTVVGQ